MTDIELIESTKIRMIAAECALRHLTGSAASVIPISGTKRVIAAGTREEIARLLGAPAVAAEVPAWQPINTMPYADDLVWLRRGDSIEGPRPMATDDYDRFSEWAPCEPPSIATPPAPATVAAELTIGRIVELMDENTDRNYGLLAEPFARAIEAEVLRGSAARDQALTEAEDAVDKVMSEADENSESAEAIGAYRCLKAIQALRDAQRGTHG